MRRVHALRRAADHGVGHRAGDVPRLGVAERPLARGPAALPRRAGVVHVAVALPPRHPLGHVAQQRLAELAHRLRGQPQLPVGGALQVAGVAQRLLQLGERAGVDRGLVAELAGELVEVDVVHPRAVVGLRELLGQVVEVGQVLQHAGAVAEAEALLAVEPLGAAPVLARPQRAQVVVERGQRLHQLGRAERLLGQGHQLGALLGRHRVHHPLRRGGPLGERVEELVDVLGVLREEVAVLVHELGEHLVGVLAEPVRLEHPVEVGEHLVDALAVLVGRVLHRLLHACEALVEQLPAEQVLDLLVVLAGLRGLPVVVAQLADRGRGR